jgi:uncharacterized protein YndB with AHSA1/START domain
MTDQTYEVSLSRYFDASPQMVYRAFTDPDQLAQWFGPITFHVPRSTVEVDARSDGHWKLVMVSNDNPEMASPVDATFSEVVENRLLVGYEISQGFPGVPDGTKLTLTVEFTPEGDGTLLQLTQGPFPEELRDMSAVGWGQSLHKLTALLETPVQYQSAPGA